MAEKKTKKTAKNATKKNNKSTKQSKKTENVENIDSAGIERKKINENFIALMMLCVSVVCLVIISLPSIGFLGKIIRSIILALFSSFSYFLFFSAIVLAIYKIIYHRTFRFERMNKVDTVIVMLIFMFVFIVININFMKDTTLSFSGISDIAMSGIEYKGTGIVPFLLSYLFFKLIGFAGIILFIIISLLYLLFKYKKAEIMKYFYSITEKISNMSITKEKYEEVEENKEKSVKNQVRETLDIQNFADDLVENHMKDLPDLDDIDISPKRKVDKYDDITDFERFSNVDTFEENNVGIIRFFDDISNVEENVSIEEPKSDVPFNKKVEMLYDKYKRDFSYVPERNSNLSNDKNTYKVADYFDTKLKEEALKELVSEYTDELEYDTNNVRSKEELTTEYIEDIEQAEGQDTQENIEDEILEYAVENVVENPAEEIKNKDVTEKQENIECSESKVTQEEYYNEKYLEEKYTFEDDDEVIEEIEEKRPYVYPTVDLLNEYKQVVTYDRAEKIRKAQLLKQTLASFGVEANVENIAVGPTITRYEIKPKVGTKVSKITNLTEDLALALAAKAIRIEAPIPGKSYIGVEIPNETSQTVSFKEVIQTCIEKRDNHNIVFAMGKDISGEVILSDITKMPHALIAGSTGSGKSVCINTIICSILYNYSPEEVKLILVDPKVVELSIYNKMPHLIIPVVTDMRKTPQALNWAVNEMERRYALFADNKSKDINSYNQKNEEKLPRIVIIIDELADLMMVAPKDIEEAICRLAQKARACGIHLIVATQRPSVDVITGLIKANIPSRIAFAVSSNTDSRTILDTGGADKLLGKGDMLYSPIGMNKPMRIQGAFLTEEEVEKVTDFIEKHNFIGNLEKMQEEVSKQIDEIVVASEVKKGNSDDELYDKVVDFAYDNDEISVSLVQRQFRIGYNRASRIVDDMEKNGIVGKSDGSKPRKVIRNQE